MGLPTLQLTGRGSLNSATLKILVIASAVLAQGYDYHHGKRQLQSCAAKCKVINPCYFVQAFAPDDFPQMVLEVHERI